MTTHTFTGTATDTMGATDSDTETLNSVASAPARVIRRTMMENRIMWGSAIDPTPKGPSFSDDPAAAVDFLSGRVCPPDDLTVSTIFQVLIPVRFTGCRVYKAPNHVATNVPITLWRSSTLVTSQASTGTELGAEDAGPWIVDGGGWQTIDFASPIDLEPGYSYVLGMYAEGGIYAFTPWVWNAQDTVVWPFLNKLLYDTTSTGRLDGSANSSFYELPPDGDIVFPRYHAASNYYLDPIIEWDDQLPAFENDDGDDYFAQWVVPHTRHAFPVAVFFADPEFLVDYYDAGVNTLVAGSPLSGNGQEYIDAMALTGAGNAMDWWVATSMDTLTVNPPYNPSASLVQLMADEPDMAEQVVGYLLWDEPDMSGTYHTPELLREWHSAMRQRDSTRPFYMNFGLWTARNQGFGWAPTGASPITVNEYWRAWSELTDIMSCDDYQWFGLDGKGHASVGTGGVWAYAAQIGRMREITDGRKPLWAVIETTSMVDDTTPDPDDVVKSIWASIIAGARGIVLFDHRFPNDFVTQDFAHMLHNPPMLAAVTAVATLLQTLGAAILGPELNLVTEWTTSNMTSGPLGGTYGVPLHYCSRSDGTYEYVFAQGIRAGATTGTLTIPTWTGETVDVIDEARTEVVSGGGVLTDSFAADYEYHLYRRTL